MMNNNNMDELLINASLEGRTPSVLPWNREGQKTNIDKEKRNEIKLNGGDIEVSNLNEGKRSENIHQRKDEKTRNISVKENLTVQSGGYEPSFMSAGARSRGLNSSVKISKALIEESKQVNLEEGEVKYVHMEELRKMCEQREVNSTEQHIDTGGVEGTDEKQDNRFKRAETEKPKQYTKPRKNVYAIYPNPDYQQKRRREYKARQQKANTKEHEDKKIHPLSILRRQHETNDSDDNAYDISPAKDRGTLSDTTDEDEDGTRTYRRTNSKDRRRCKSREKSDKGNKHTLVGIVTPEINPNPVRNSREITKKSKKKRAQNVIDVIPCKPIEHATIGNKSDSMMRVPADHKNTREPRPSKSYTVTKHYKNTDTLNKNSILTRKSVQQVNSSIGIGGINKTTHKEGHLRISVKPLETMSGDATERHDNGEYHNNDTVLHVHVVVNTEIPSVSSTADDMEILLDEVSKLPEESDNYLNHMIRRSDSAISVDPKLPNAWVDDRNQLRDIEIVCDLQSELSNTNENEPQHVSEESEKKLDVFQRLFSLVTCCFRPQTDH